MFKRPLKVNNQDNRVPPGQTVTDKFPVLTDGPAPEKKNPRNYPGTFGKHSEKLRGHFPKRSEKIRETTPRRS